MKLVKAMTNEFNVAFNKLLKQDLKVSVAFKLRKVLKNIQEEGKVFDELKQTIIEKYSEKDEEGKPKSNENGNIVFDPKFNAELGEQIEQLNNLEVAVEKIKAEDLSDKVELSIVDLEALEDIFE
jgi:hypothetical protein